MGIEASVIIANFNKERALLNTLHALAGEVDFPEIEVIVVDDHSRNDPEPVVKKVFGDKAKYMRFPANVGGRVARSMACRIMDPASKIIVTIASDVMVITPGIIRAMLEAVSPGEIVLPEVKSIPVPPDVWENVQLYKDRLLESWQMYEDGIRIYQGSRRPDHKNFLFCAAALKEDLFSAGYEDLSCDFWLDAKMRKAGLKMKWMDWMKAIHQMHSFVQHPCSEIGTCEFSKSCEKRGVRQLEGGSCFSTQKECSLSLPTPMMSVSGVAAS